MCDVSEERALKEGQDIRVVRSTRVHRGAH